MKKNGFTLIEILAVITLLAALTLIILPTITNQLNQSKGTLNEATVKLMGEAAYTYIDMNQSKYPMKEGNVYCLTLETLVKYGNLKEPVQDIKTGANISLKKIVRAEFTSDIDINYTIVDSCAETR